MRRKQPMTRKRFRQISLVPSAQKRSIANAEAINKLIPKTFIIANRTPMKLKKEAIDARKRQDFRGAANAEYMRLIATLQRKGQVSTVMECLKNMERDCRDDGDPKGLARTKEIIKYLNQILRHYKYPSY